MPGWYKHIYACTHAFFRSIPKVLAYAYKNQMPLNIEGFWVNIQWENNFFNCTKVVYGFELLTVKYFKRNTKTRNKKKYSEFYGIYAMSYFVLFCLLILLLLSALPGSQ